MRTTAPRRHRATWRTRRLLVPVALLLLMLLLSVAGCFRLSRNAPLLSQYVLGSSMSDGSPQLSAGDESASYRVGMRRIDMAAYLATPAIVLRRGAHEIVTSEFHRWGEDLGSGINRSVALRLANVAPVGAVSVAPWAPRTDHDLLVQLHVRRFEGFAEELASTGAVHVLAAWEILRPLDGQVLVRGETEYRDGLWTVGDYEALVAQLDVAVDRIASDIRGCLSRFAADSLPPPSCGQP